MDGWRGRNSGAARLDERGKPVTRGRVALWQRCLVAVATLAFLAVGCAPAGKTGTQKGSVAPDFSLPALVGEAQSLRDYRGHVVVLNFWASWCGPCRAEMPDMQVVYSELRDRGLVVLGVNQGEGGDQVKAFASEFGLSFPILLDVDRNVGATYGVNAYPTTFIVDGDGVIRQVIVGGPLSRMALRGMVEGLLK